VSPHTVPRLCQPWIPQTRLTQPWHELISAGSKRLNSYVNSDSRNRGWGFQPKHNDRLPPELGWKPQPHRFKAPLALDSS